MRKKTTLALGSAALLWLCGLLLTESRAQAQTTTDQTDKTTTSKKKKKSAKSTEQESSQAAAPAETGKKKTKTKKAKTSAQEETKPQAEETTKPKRSKKSATEVPSQSFVPPGIPGGKAEESAAPARNASAAQIRSAKSNGMVWVNTDSGIYHKSGRWYGATKQGKFMTEDEAVRAGYKAAQNEK